jgi:hypothetical protein
MHLSLLTLKQDAHKTVKNTNRSVPSFYILLLKTFAIGSIILFLLHYSLSLAKFCRKKG